MSNFLNPNPLMGVYIVYSIIRKLVIPFDKTDAYKHGIIDARGKVLRPRNTLKTQSEKDAYTVLDVLVFKLKKMIEQMPGGKSRLASYAAALWLIKEAKNYDFYILNDDILNEDVQEFIFNFLKSDDSNSLQIRELFDLAEGKFYQFVPQLKFNENELNKIIKNFLNTI